MSKRLVERKKWKIANAVVFDFATCLLVVRCHERKSSFPNALNFWKESRTKVRLVSKLPQQAKYQKGALWQHTNGITIKEAALKCFIAVTVQETVGIGNVSSPFKFLWEPLSFRDWTMNTPKCTVKKSTYTIFSLTQRCFRGLAQTSDWLDENSRWGNIFWPRILCSQVYILWMDFAPQLCFSSKWFPLSKVCTRAWWRAPKWREMTTDGLV